jgi:hypothetical protein
MPMAATGAGRKNPRDFPDNTLCPINLGWFVDPTTGLLQPPPAQPIRPALGFTATGPAAEIALVACDRGLGGDHPDGFDLWIRDFAVVRQDAYESHQLAGPYPDFTCYLPNSGEDFTPFIRRVGSSFDRTLAPSLKALTPRLPFFDDFSNLNTSRKRWKLDGADFQTVDLNDPRTGPFTGNTLVLARVPAGAGDDACSKASVRVKNLKKGTNYVIDFQWETKGIVAAPEIDMITFIDTEP